MFVSLLQLIGFPMAKPVHSPAEPAQAAEQAQTVAVAQEHAQGGPARRQPVKKASGNENHLKQNQGEVVEPKVKKAGVVAAKSAEKTVKTPVAVNKPVVGKSVANKAVAVKTAPAKQVEAAAAPAKTAKPPVLKNDLPEGKTGKAISAVPAKAAAKGVPAEPKPFQAVAAPTVVKPVAPVETALVATKSGRPSSRLAQLTVPSMAQTVASTAAKASYTQAVPTPVIVPALPSTIRKDEKLANNWKTKPVADLSDAELLAMPDSEYMNEVQIAAFRLKLEALKRDILNSAGETTEHLREDTSVVPDPADRATIEEEHALELRTRDRERKLLKKIEQSLVRIDANDYGYCDETGEPIGVGRLLARPTATLSLEAQQRRELKQKMFGD